MAAAVIAGIGIAVSAYGQIQQANAQASAAQKDADAKRSMADEVLARNKMNDESLQSKLNSDVGNQKSQYAAGNVDISSGTPLAVMENTLYEGRRQMMMNDEEAQFRAQQYLIGGNAQRDLSGQYQQAGYIGAGGTILTGAGTMAAKGGVFDKKTG